MLSLHELQTGFMQALFAPASGEERLGIVARGIDSHARLGIYANNARVNFVESLRTSFPAVLRLVGDAYFRQSALQFRELHPSKSGDLQLTGLGFADFLAHIHGNDEFGYLADVARLEWSCQEALISANHPPFRLEKLTGLEPSTYADLRFVLHPSLRLFSSQYPCQRIWQANLADTTDAMPIDLRDGPDRLAILRTAGELRLHGLSVGELHFLQFVLEGVNFGTAVDRTLEVDVEFDAAAALRRAVCNGAIVDCL